MSKFVHLMLYEFCFFSHGFLRVTYGSDVEKGMDVLEGDTRTGLLSVGNYTVVNSSPVNKDFARGSTLYVRPKKPFGISTKQWGMLFIC